MAFEQLHLCQAHSQQWLGFKAEDFELFCKSGGFTKQGDEVFDSAHQPLQVHLLLDLICEIELLLSTSAVSLWIKLDKNGFGSNIKLHEHFLHAFDGLPLKQLGYLKRFSLIELVLSSIQSNFNDFTDPSDGSLGHVRPFKDTVKCLDELGCVDQGPAIFVLEFVPAVSHDNIQLFENL